MLKTWNMWLGVAFCVLVIVGLVVPSLTSRLDGTVSAQRHKEQMDLETFSVLIAKFRARNHRYPRDDEGLGAVLPLGVGMSQIRDRHPLDPWGRPYVYRTRADGTPELYSLGANGVDEPTKGNDISVELQ
jgi:general secretion pathway protein G